MFESEVGRRRVQLQAAHDQEPHYRTSNLWLLLNNLTCWRSANVQQHRVVTHEIFIIHVCILSTLDTRDEIVQRIPEIRMQIAKDIDEWLIINRAVIPGPDHGNEQLGHQHTIILEGGWHPKLVEPHSGHGGIFEKNDQLPKMIWHTTDDGLCVLQICSDHQGQAIQIEFPADRGREHACLLDVVQWRTHWNDVVDG